MASFYLRLNMDLIHLLFYDTGLIDTDWGGTPIEAWSSVDALSQCNKQTKSSSTSPIVNEEPYKYNVMYNAR